MIKIHISVSVVGFSIDANLLLQWLCQITLLYNDRLNRAVSTVVKYGVLQGGKSVFSC
jgi:hypothetical protein